MQALSVVVAVVVVVIIVVVVVLLVVMLVIASMIWPIDPKTMAALAMASGIIGDLMLCVMNVFLRHFTCDVPPMCLTGFVRGLLRSLFVG